MYFRKNCALFFISIHLMFISGRWGFSRGIFMTKMNHWTGWRWNVYFDWTLKVSFNDFHSPLEAFHLLSFNVCFPNCLLSKLIRPHFIYLHDFLLTVIGCLLIMLIAFSFSFSLLFLFFLSPFFFSANFQWTYLKIRNAAHSIQSWDIVLKKCCPLCMWHTYV